MYDELDPGVRRLAAAVFLFAIQSELKGETGNLSFLTGQGYFDHWAMCLEYKPEAMLEKINKALRSTNPHQGRD